jgi:hypothetical protein
MRNVQAPRPLGRRGLHVVVAVFLAALIGASWVAPAMAESLDGGRSRVVVHVDGGPLTFDRMAPGIGRTQDLWLITRRDHPVDVRLGVRHLVSRDNGCLRPERRAGDTTCGSAGELLPWLHLTLDRIDDGVAVPVYDGSLAALATLERGVAAGGPVSSRRPVHLRMRIVPAEEMGNDTMTDSVDFSLWWSAAGVLRQLPATGAAGAPAAVVTGEALVLSGQSGTGLPREPGVPSRPWVILLGATFVLLAGWLVRRVLPRG